MRVIKIQTNLHLCERHLEKLTTSPLSSHLLNYFHLTTSHKNLKYSGFVRQFRNFVSMAYSMCTFVLPCLEISDTSSVAI